MNTENFSLSSPPHLIGESCSCGRERVYSSVTGWVCPACDRALFEQHGLTLHTCCWCGELIAEPASRNEALLAGKDRYCSPGCVAEEAAVQVADEADAAKERRIQAAIESFDRPNATDALEAWKRRKPCR